MSIVSSIIVSDSLQKDGRRQIRERHTDHVGVMHELTYIAEVAANTATALAARPAMIVERLRQGEINANLAKALNAETTFTFQHSTVAENRTALRELFKVATKWELMTLAFVINSMALSDAQLRALFSVTVGETAALKTRLSTITTKYTEALALVGQ